jgi:hypothetical protein
LLLLKKKLIIYKKPSYKGAKEERDFMFFNVGQALGEAYLCEPMTRAFSTLVTHCYSLTFSLKLKVRSYENLSLVFD